ncbi:unnamed protein product [Diamesa serratosioi]
MEDSFFKVPTIGEIKKVTKPENINKAISSETSNDCPYKEPNWSGAPTEYYGFEVLKNGQIVEQIKNLESKNFWVFGRLPQNEIVAAHPTVSRHHCVLQYRPQIESEEGSEEPEIEKGWFIFDLDSTHGTFLNRMRVRPKTYIRIRVGMMLKLGSSTRNFILQGPMEDSEIESELSVTELKQQKIQRDQEREEEKQTKERDELLELERLEKLKESQGISWGMADDAEDEPDLTENPFAVTNNEELFLNDPKKTLRGFFEREGHNLEYKCDELSPGTFVCRITLPIDDDFGKPIVAEVQHKGKKKDCVANGALEACRILDRHGVLRQANHEPRRAKAANYSDSDSDDYLDRTGDVEKKRLKKAPLTDTIAFTYDELLVQEQELLEKIKGLEEKLQVCLKDEKAQKQSQNNDNEDLDAFMSNLSNLDKKVDKFEIRNIKLEIQTMKADHVKHQKLMNAAKPTFTLPPILEASSSKPKLSMFGKRSKLGSFLGIKKHIEVLKATEEVEFKVEEEEEAVLAPESPVENVVNKPLDVVVVEVEETKLTAVPETKTETELKAPQVVPIEKEIPEKDETVEPKQSNKRELSAPESLTSAKKRKNRIRIRYRENVDIDDAEEAKQEEKVSKWVPPENQTGDGSTHLNDKYGY